MKKFIIWLILKSNEHKNILEAEITTGKSWILILRLGNAQMFKKRKRGTYSFRHSGTGYQKNESHKSTLYLRIA